MRLLTLLVLRLVGWRVLPLRPGDTLVVEIKLGVSAARVERLTNIITASYPDVHVLAIVGDDMRLSHVLRSGTA